MRIKKYILVVVLGGFIGFVSIKSLCDIEAVGGGCIAGTAGGVVTFYLLKEAAIHGGVKNFITTLVTVGGGVLFWKFLSQFTPDGRLQRAVGKIKKAEANVILSKSFVSSAELISLIREQHISSRWPLVDAKFELERLRKSLLDAQGLLVVVEGRKSGVVFVNKCKRYFAKSDVLLKKTVDAIKIIITDVNCNAEFDRYERDRLAWLEREQKEREIWQKMMQHFSERSQRERHHRETVEVQQTVRERENIRPDVHVTIAQPSPSYVSVEPSAPPLEPSNLPDAYAPSVSPVELENFSNAYVPSALQESTVQQPAYTPLPPRLYPEKGCCVCLEEFDGANVKEIFLECGHDICTVCFAKLYRHKGTNTKCPLCRKSVSSSFIQSNTQILWVPSAPPMD